MYLYKMFICFNQSLHNVVYLSSIESPTLIQAAKNKMELSSVFFLYMTAFLDVAVEIRGALSDLF